MFDRFFFVVTNFILVSLVHGQHLDWSKQQEEDWTKVIVVGGSQHQNDQIHTLANAEIVNLANDGLIFNPPEDYPFECSGMVSTYLNGQVLVCGGICEQQNSCFQLDQDTLTWNEMISMPEGRWNSASSNIDGKWFITGHYVDIPDLPTTTVYDNGIFLPGPELPFPKNKHCQITLNDTHIFFTGGQADFRSTFLLDWPRQEWIILEELPPFARAYDKPACGMVDTAELGPEIVVAEVNAGAIFSLAELAWREGPPLPIPIGNIASVQLNNGFLAVGGFEFITEPSVSHDDIFRFDPETYDWVMEEAKLLIDRESAVAIAVPDDFLAPL